jgi:hypothetical protein
MPNDLRRVWQSQRRSSSPVSLESIRRKSRRLEGTMQQQFVTGYIVSLIVVLMASYIYWQLDEIFFRMGAGALVLVALSVVYQARKVLPRRVALDATPSASFDFYRRELERQISYLRAGRNIIWPILVSGAFFLTPFVRGAIGKPGMPGFDLRESRYLLFGLVPSLSVMMIVAVSAFVATGRKASKIQSEIDEVDEFTRATRP